MSNLRASKSDDKKFYVYSGTKTLDIRAETPEDRSLWLRILEVRAPETPLEERATGWQGEWLACPRACKRSGSWKGHGRHYILRCW